MMHGERRIIIGGVIALMIIPAAMFFLHREKAPVVDTNATSAIPVPGAPGAVHAHVAFVVNILGVQQNFTDPDKYMLQSKRAHFEDGNPVILHKHTTGVTIPFFLSTLKIFLNKDCIDFEERDPPVKYCTNATNTLRMIVNGGEIPDPEVYEVQNNDRILVTYGPESGAHLKLIFNQVPHVSDFKELTTGEAEPNAIPDKGVSPTP